jgi:hypothetical protein
MMSSVTLPWPARRLSPNARGHWGGLAKARAKARRDAYFACVAAGLRNMGGATATVLITFHPPSHRRFDADNAIAQFKAGADGVADAIGVDDARWRVTYAMGAVVKGGAVVVEVGA